MNVQAETIEEFTPEGDWIAEPTQGDAPIDQLRGLINGIHISPTANFSTLKVWLPVWFVPVEEGYIPYNDFGELIGRPQKLVSSKSEPIPVDWIVPKEKMHLQGFDVEPDGSVYMFDCGYKIPWDVKPGMRVVIGNILRVLDIELKKLPRSAESRGVGTF